MTSPPIALESCSHPQKMRQVFESAMKTYFWFWFFCELCHKWGRVLAILAKVTWPWTQLLGGSILLKLYCKLGKIRVF